MIRYVVIDGKAYNVDERYEYEAATQKMFDAGLDSVPTLHAEATIFHNDPVHGHRDGGEIRRKGT